MTLKEQCDACTNESCNCKPCKGKKNISYGCRIKDCLFDEDNESICPELRPRCEFQRVAAIV